MGAELGATTSIFPYDKRMQTYLEATERTAIAKLAKAHAELLRPDPEVLKDPARYFDVLIEIDLSKLEPHVVGPHTPDLARPISQIEAGFLAVAADMDLPGRVLVLAPRNAGATVVSTG